MFNFLKKDPVKKLEQKYLALMEQARDKQRAGDIKGYALIMEKTEEIVKEIDKLKAMKS